MKLAFAFHSYSLDSKHVHIFRVKMYYVELNFKSNVNAIECVTIVITIPTNHEIKYELSKACHSFQHSLGDENYMENYNAHTRT